MKNIKYLSVRWLLKEGNYQVFFLPMVTFNSVFNLCDWSQEWDWVAIKGSWKSQSVWGSNINVITMLEAPMFKYQFSIGLIGEWVAIKGSCKYQSSICLMFKYRCSNIDVQISMFKYRCSNINVQISMFKYQCSNTNFQFVWVESGMRLGCHKRKLKISMINLFEVQISMFKYQCSNIKIEISMFNFFYWT